MPPAVKLCMTASHQHLKMPCGKLNFQPFNALRARLYAPVANRQLRLPCHKDVSRARFLVQFSGTLQVYFSPLTADNSLPYLPCRLSLLVHGICVIEFFHANVTLRAVCIFKAAMQTVVPHTVAVTIARLLVQNGWNLFSQLIRMRLEIVAGVLSPKVLPCRELQVILFRSPGGPRYMPALRLAVK